MIESGDDDKKVGDHGKSFGRYQFTFAAWREVTTVDFRMVHIESWSSLMAKRLPVRRQDKFRRAFKRNPTPREIYILWNAPAQIKKSSKRVLERAIRFENLVEQKMREGTR
jgi:hypothetical protein